MVWAIDLNPDALVCKEAPRFGKGSICAGDNGSNFGFAWRNFPWTA
jgi:hypothetical protein